MIRWLHNNMLNDELDVVSYCNQQIKVKLTD